MSSEPHPASGFYQLSITRETSAWSSQQCLFPEKLYPKVTRDLNTPVALEILMTTC
ncbi:uncharacterized protein LOC142332356 isoform X2 [Lycorma delicatula]|uniref:uncharacterized protein LOC142323033 isoform X2 n=1 Tax=Lycorma delicatula TaxID=130591 RepID=UPI003F50F530